MAMTVGGKESGSGTLAEINVTPLVDVMLVLLIVFMVTAPMLQTGVEVNLPEAKAKTIPDDTGLLIVTVAPDHKVYIGKMEVAPDAVEATLKSNAKLQVDHEAYLHADQSLPYGEIVKVMAAMQLAGAEKVGLITDPLK
jgi:biopolymer transport protein TolR